MITTKCLFRSLHYNLKQSYWVVQFTLLCESDCKVAHCWNIVWILIAENLRPPFSSISFSNLTVSSHWPYCPIVFVRLAIIVMVSRWSSPRIHFLSFSISFWLITASSSWPYRPSVEARLFIAKMVSRYSSPRIRVLFSSTNFSILCPSSNLPVSVKNIPTSTKSSILLSRLEVDGLPALISVIKIAIICGTSQSLSCGIFGHISIASVIRLNTVHPNSHYSSLESLSLPQAYTNLYIA